MAIPNGIKRVICLLLAACFFFQNTLTCYGQALMPALIPQAINFSPPTLKYLSVNSANPYNYFNFLLDKGSKPALANSGAGLEQEAKKLIHYFFIGLTLSESSLWVNLRPDEPGRITSLELAQTDMGKLLLEQDLRLKKDVAQYLNPKQPIGKRFWEELYTQAELLLGKGKLKKTAITTSNRVWIVPDEAVVMETEDGALVTQAKLKVLLESEYLSLKSKSWNKEVEVQVQNKDQLKNLTEQLMKSIIIPEITKEVNFGQSYAPLRQIYHSLILAQWFKQKYRKQKKDGKDIPYIEAIDQSWLKGLESEFPWSKDAIWKEYLTSFQKGEYQLKEKLAGLNRMYTSGGIAFFHNPSSSPLVVDKLGVSLPLAEPRTERENTALAVTRVPLGKEDSAGDVKAEWLPDIMAIEPDGTEDRSPSGGSRAEVDAYSEKNAKEDVSAASPLAKERKKEPNIRSFFKKIGKSLFPGYGGGNELTFREYLDSGNAISIGELIAMQVSLNKPMTLSTRFSQELASRLNNSVEYWNHNISNFIARQFAEHERGIVELISNALDASSQGASVSLRPGEIVVANGDKGISLEEVFTSLLIPTLSTKRDRDMPGKDIDEAIKDEKIGRFGVGFLSSFNYLESPDDTMEIISFNQGKGFRIRMGVERQGDGRNARKVVILKSIEEDISLSQDEEKELFPSISSPKDGGTSIKIKSGSIREIDAIDKEIEERFTYWSGEPVVVTKTDESIRHEKKTVGLRKDKYMIVHRGADGRAGRQFQLIALLNDGDLSRVEPAYAAHPGEGRLIITLQGVVLATINIPGSNVFSELEVNLPSSAKIPTSRDKVIIEKNTIDAIFNSARGVLNNSGLDAKAKIAILNSLYYLLEWAWTTNPSLRSRRTLQEFVDAIISEQEKLINSNETTLFLPDTLQTREFFDATKNIILVNPNLLPKIKYARRGPQELEAGEYPAAAKARGFKIFVVPTKGERPALRLGNMVFLKDSESGRAGRGDIIWQHIVIATVINYWEYMMRQLSFEDARFASAGSYSGIDETEAKKEKVIAYFRSKIEELEKDITSGEDGLGVVLASYQRLLFLVEGNTNLAQGLFYIFKDEIASYTNASLLIYEAAEDVAKDFSGYLGGDLFNKDNIINFVRRHIDFYKFYNIDMAKMIKEKPFIETVQKDKPKTPDLVGIVVNLIGPSGDPRKVEMPQDLNDNEKELVFMIEIVTQWLEQGGDPVAKFFEELAASPNSHQIWESLREAIAGYYDRFSALSEIEEKDVKNLLDFLSLIYINRYANTENKGLLPKTIPLNHPSRLVAKGALADIAATFYAAGDDISIADIIEDMRKGGLRFRAAIGQIQQSINYQDPEEFVFIRELLQNAIDAIRKAAKNGNTDSGSRRIDMVTRLVNDEDGVGVEFAVKDSVGMDMEEVINYLLIANRSSKKEEFLTGFFGHGFFTTLRESEEVWIKTSSGKGKVVIARLIPNLDAEEGVITGVDYELYEEYSDALPGTEIVWRKRGQVSSIDEILLRAKAEMFSRTLEGNFKLFLNEKEIDRLDRNSSLLTEFVAGNGARVKVYHDEGRASLTVQKGLFVTRLDRRFISDVLGISVGSDLFNLLSRLSDLGVVLEIPQEINLTRDRAHFIRRDLTSGLKGAIIGALFDAAIKGMLSGKIALPYKFDYDFLTRMYSEPLVDPGTRERAYSGINLLKGTELSQLVDFLQHPNAILLNVAKNWMIGNTDLQGFLDKIKNIVNKESSKAKEFILGFVKSPEFAALIEAIKNNSLDDKQLESIKSFFESRVIGAFGEKIYSSKLKAKMKNFSPHQRNNSIANADLIGAVMFAFENTVENLYRNSVKDQIAQEVKQLAYIQKVRELTNVMDIDRLREWSADTQRLASPESIPAIGDAITSFLSDKFIASNPLSLEEVLFMVEKAAGKEADETGGGFEETMKDLSDRPDPPLKRSVSLKQIEYHKFSLPYIYYFLKATQAFVNNLKQSSQRILGEELYPGSIGVGVYYDPSDMATLARGGNGIITWHLVGHTFQHMRNLLDYLHKPDDSKFDAFLSSMIETLTHEMTHEEEGRQRAGGQGGTHNKSFFDKQLRLLGAALNDQKLHQSIENELSKLSEEYLSNSDSEEFKNSINEFLKPRVENIAVIDKINNILSGQAQKSVFSFSPAVVSLENKGEAASSSPLEQEGNDDSSEAMERQEALGKLNDLLRTSKKVDINVIKQMDANESLFKASPELRVLVVESKDPGHTAKRRIDHVFDALEFFESLSENVLNTASDEQGNKIKEGLAIIRKRIGQDLNDLYLLRLAILLHDIGKRPEKEPLEASHEERGAADVLPLILGRIEGLTDEDKETISYLVANHSAFSFFGNKRDNSEEAKNNLVVEAADVLGDDLKRIEMLYLLNVADFVALDAEEKKNSSIGLLFLEIPFKFISDTLSVEGGLEKARKMVKEEYLQGILPEYGEKIKELYLGLVGLPFIAGAGLKRIENHLSLLKAVSQGEAAVKSSKLVYYDNTQYMELVVGVPQDKPGLLRLITGILADRGYDIHLAQINTTDRGVIFDRFLIKKDPGQSDDGLEQELVGEINSFIESGKISLNMDVIKQKLPKLTSSELKIDFEKSDDGKIKQMTIKTRDGMGLLFRITDIFSRFGINLLKADIRTWGSDVGNTFLIQQNGEPLTKELENSLRIELVRELTASSSVANIDAGVEEKLEKARQYFEELNNKFGVVGTKFGGARDLSGSKSRASTFYGKIYEIYFNSIWINKMPLNEIERTMAHEIQHTRTFFLEDNTDKLHIKLGGLVRDAEFQELQRRIGVQYDKVGFGVFEHEKVHYQTYVEILPLLRGYEIYLRQKEEGADITTQPYEFIEAFREDDLKFLDEEFLRRVTEGYTPPKSPEPLVITKKRSGSLDTGGIDLSQIEVTLKDDKFVSQLNPADLKVLRAAKYLKEGWGSLSLLYVHEIMLLLKDNLAGDIKQKGLLQEVLKQLQVKGFVVPEIKLV